MNKLLKRIAVAMAGILLFAAFFLIGASLTQTTPKLILTATGLSRWDYHPAAATTIYYRDGQPMTQIGYQRVYSQDFPEFMKAAVVAVEDRRFYEHGGLDTKSIGRAIYVNLLAGSRAQGASTITQQLARTMFLSQNKTYSRKIKEVLLATALEEKFTKEQILNMYLNEIYMGRGCSGMACAAQAYFNKDIWSLNQAQICLLVGLIQSPEHYNPETNWEGLKTRQEVVINVLTEQGLLDIAAADQLKQQPLTIAAPRFRETPHPYLVSYLTWLMEDLTGKEHLYQGGLAIYTTIDRTMQTQSENALENSIRNLVWRGVSARDGALVSIEPGSGAVRAMVGGADFKRNQLNMAVLPRQPGSAIKPLYYAAAINERLLNSDTIINNSSRDFGGYQPRNSNSRAPARVTVRDALINSYNVASVEVLNRLGLDKAFRYLESFGITTLKQSDHHLALGLGGMSEGIPPLELAQAFAVFPAQGELHPYFVIERVVDRDSTELFRSKTRGSRVISTRTARTMDEILTGVVSWGTGTRAAIAIRSAGKTGTTTDSRDLWYVGYTSDLVTAVWIGNSDGTPVTGPGTSGGGLAAPVWREYMSSLYYRGALQQKPAWQPGNNIQPSPEVPEENPPPENVPEEDAGGEGNTTGQEPGTEPAPAPPPETVPVPQPELEGEQTPAI